MRPYPSFSRPAAEHDRQGCHGSLLCQQRHLCHQATVTVYNSTAAYVRDTVLAPFTAARTELGVPAAIGYTELSYYDHYNAYMGPSPMETWVWRNTSSAAG